MSEKSSIATLNCYCIDDPPENIIAVDVPYDAKVLDLVFAFTKLYKELGLGVAKGQKIYKVDCTDTDLTVTLGEPLRLFRPVEAYWPRPNELNITKVHVFIRASVKRPIINTHPEDEFDNLPYLFRGLELLQAATASAYRTGKSASQAAVASSFMFQQHGDNPLLNGRPFMRTGLPIQLYHPVFDTFTRALDTAKALGNSKYAETEALLHACQEIYEDEKLRWEGIEPHLCRLLPSLGDEGRVEKSQVDGTITFVKQYGLLKACCAILEVRNEVGTGKSDPSIQGGGSYALYWSQEQVSKLRRVCRCPSFIIALAGPWMCILGAVYLEHVIVQPLSDYMWLGHHPQQDRRLSDLTRVFHALDVATRELRTYYETLFTSLGPSYIRPCDIMRFFPHFCSFQDEDLQEIRFEYLSMLGEGNLRRPVFKALTETGKEIVVKFAQQYGVSGHRLLASHGLAPKVLFHESPRSRAGFHTIVMEYVPFTHLHHDGGKVHLENVKVDIRKAMGLLHESNLVFGDIRTPNILVVERSSGFYGGMLVDFDWCGQEGKARYPAGMVLEDRASTAEKGGLISKDHDRAMFDMVFG